MFPVSGYAEKEGNWRGNQILPDVPDAEIWRDFLSHYDRVLPLALGLLDVQHDPREREVYNEILERYDLRNTDELQQGRLTDEKVR